ncbi:MAG: ADOP family duplicated permease [Wenzhouxiangellaceae bacterium]
MIRFSDDIRAALRQFALAPLLTLTAVVSLAAALGAGTLLFSIVNSLLLSPVAGVADAARMVEIGRTTQSFGFDSLSLANLRDLEHKTTTTDALYGHSALTMNLLSAEGPVRINGRLVSGGYFRAMKLTPQAGRLIQAADDRPGAPERVAVLSNRLYQDRFGADASVLGSTLTVNGLNVTVAGIAPPGFDHPGLGARTDLYLPLGLAAELGRLPADAFESRGSRWMMAGGRLAEGRSIEDLNAELTSLGDQLETAWPVANREIGYTAKPMRALPPPARMPVTVFVGMLFALVGVVLLVATTNVASLLLARGEDRRRELAMRQVLGAGRGRLLRQMLVETLVLVMAAGGLGTAAAWVAKGTLERIELPVPEPIALNLDLTFSPTVMAFLVAAVLLTTLLAGLLPAWRSSRRAPGQVLAGSGRSVAGSRGNFRMVLAGTQVAFSLLLLVLAGLFVNAVQRAGDIDIGYRVDGVYTASIDLKPTGFDYDKRVALIERYVTALGDHPGFESAAAAAVVPLSMSRMGLGDFFTEGGDAVDADLNVVSGNFFETLEIPVRGRVFDDRDRDGGEAVAIVNESLARRLAPEGDALGKVFGFGSPDENRPMRIVGITPDGRYRDISDTGTGFVYLPYRQNPRSDMHVFVRSEAGLREVDRRMTEIQADIDSRLLKPLVQPLEDIASLTLLPQKIAGGLATTLGVLGSLLAAIGLYGMLAQLVASHTHEIGIRIALGAAPAAIRRRMIWIGARPAVWGAVIGMLLAALAATALEGYLFGVRGRDTLAFAAALALITLICAAVLARPALRAARILPSEALRDE